MNKILIIQTAFIGDVILATPVISALREKHPEAEISILVRRGNESLLVNHPELREVLVWDKGKAKYSNLLRLIRMVRSRNYDAVYNLHRFATSGMVTFYSKARLKFGFSKNPFAFCYTSSKTHRIGDGTHEIQRNLSLVEENPKIRRPELYPGPDDEAAVESYVTDSYVCIAPASVWNTKQFHLQGWIDLIKALPDDEKVYLLGAPDDAGYCESILRECDRSNLEVLAGKISVLQSAALMKRAKMNYVNDSAPLHLASAMNAPVRAVFCSTIPEFGFGPVSDDSKVVQIDHSLYCRPCGLHGYKACPEKHFKCARKIKTDQFFQ